MGIQNELRKFVAPEFIFGNNSRLLVNRYVENYGGKHVFLMTDKGISEAGWTDEMINILEQRNFKITKFDAITSNPRDYEVMAGAELYKESLCDAIVAIGGGSVMDCAKGIGIIATNGGDILSYEGVDQIINAIPPLICIPTTAGSSSDVSQFAIVNDTGRKNKIAICSKSIVPDVALIDPVVLTTMSPYLTACTGIDALVHAIEAYISIAASPITDLHAIESIRLISSNIVEAVNNPDNVQLRGLIMQASLQAGLAFSNASLGCVHSMSHGLGGFLDLPHGECNALLLPHVINFNFSSVPDRLNHIAEVMGCDTRGMSEKESCNKLFDFIVDLQKKCGIKGGLEPRGVKFSDIGYLAKNAMNDICMATNPRVPNHRDVEVIYQEAL